MIREQHEHEQSIAPELLRYFSDMLSRWHARLPHGRVPASIYKELLLPHRLRAPDLAWESQAAKARGIAEPAIRAILEPLTAAYFADGQRLLEVGAGTLAGGRSYISRYFNHLPRLSWTTSDTSEVLKRWSGQLEPGTFFELNLTGEPARSPDVQPFDGAVASNVFDTLPYADFTAALATIARLVRPGQVFVHIADLNFYVNAFLDACGTAGSVLFPSAAPHKLIHAISKDGYRAALAAARPDLTAVESAFLKSWGTQHPQILSAVIGDAFLTGKDMSSFAQRVEHVFAGKLRPLQQIGLFQRSLGAAATQTGWSVLECGFRVSEVVLPRRSLIDGPFNKHELDEGAVIGRVDPSIPAGLEKMRAKVHVFVARRQ